MNQPPPLLPLPLPPDDRGVLFGFTRLHLMLAIKEAHDDGLKNFTAALIKLYHQEFPTP